MTTHGNISLLNPYRTSGIVSDPSMIVGREKELTKLTSEYGVFIVYGPRKIGKSTLLYEAKRELDKNKRLVVYMDCINTESLREFLNLIRDEINDHPGIKTHCNGFGNLEELRKSLHEIGSVTLFLDEFDRIFRWDEFHNKQGIQKWLHMIASTAIGRRIRIVIAGWDAVFRAELEELNPLFYESQNIALNPLSQEETARLISIPMSRMYIDLRNEKAITQAIYHYTAGYPALVQCIGGLLIKHLAKERRAFIKHDDVRIVSETNELELEMQQNFTTNVEGLARLILFEMLRLENATTSRLLEKIIERHGIDVEFRRLESAIILLRSRGTIRQTSVGTFELGNQLIKNCLKRLGDLRIREMEAVNQFLSE